MENEVNLLLPLRTQKLKGFQLQGDLAPPDFLTRASAPGPRWGLRLQTPVIGSRSALAMCVHPTYFDLATPLHRSVLADLNALRTHRLSQSISLFRISVKQFSHIIRPHRIHSHEFGA